MENLDEFSSVVKVKDDINLENNLSNIDIPSLTSFIETHRQEIIDSLVEKGHKDWQESRNGDPRIKVCIENNEGEERWINEEDQIPEGFEEVKKLDIANTNFNDLPDYFKNQNTGVNNYVMALLEETLNTPDPEIYRMVDDISTKIHDLYLVNNPNVKGKELDVPFEELSFEEREKDRVYVRNMIFLLLEKFESEENISDRPKDYPKRFEIPEDLKDWDKKFPTYNPSDYEIEEFSSKTPPVWADPEDYKEVDFTKRYSHEGDIKFDKEGKPLNPKGRMGILGRGKLGKWGPNHAVDPMITKFGENNELQILLIQRKDNGQWALPGGMIDDGENSFKTLSRELSEETGVSIDLKDSVFIYNGYVEDIRETDNAWMETEARHKHLTEEESKNMDLKPDTDAKKSDWFTLTNESLNNLKEKNNIYGDHAKLLEKLLN
jgi:ADP-ribose pyrophosphatase